MELCIQILTLLLLLLHLKALLRGPLEVGVHISVNFMRAVNTAYTPFPEVPDERVSLLLLFLCNLWYIFGCFSLPPLLTSRPGLHALHGMTVLYEGVVAHIKGRGGLYGQFINHST